MSDGSPFLEIHLLGAPQLFLDGQALQRLRRKNCALLYYLAAQGQPLTREQLLVFFWPDHERADAQPILRTMIHDLRKYLGKALHADEKTLALASDTVIDANTFTKVLQSPKSDVQALVNALALYRGHFLEGFSLVDSSQFNDWAAFERDRYQLMAMHGFADLARRYEALQDYSSALEAMRHAVAFNPFQEDLQRDLMHLLYLKGDRAGVIRQYENLRKVLDEELGVPPMPETRTLYDAIINDTYRPSPSEFLRPTLALRSVSEEVILPFIGREEELETLNDHLGSGKLILLEGEPGIGKTRLVSELIAIQMQTKQPPLILQGVAHELEQILPYQPIVDALRSLFIQTEWRSLSKQLDLQTVWLTELARLLPELITQFPHIPTPTQPADESRLWESMLQFFRALSRRRTVWLFLDDLHWADHATIGWLGYLIRRVDSSPLIVISSSRPGEEPANLTKLLQALKREDRLVHLPLSVLSPPAMYKLATVLSPKNKEQLSAWLIENAEGNPFFLTELVRYAYKVGLLKANGMLEIDLFITSPILPATIQNLIESRLLRLSENGRHILHLAAIIGREFEFELAQKASTLPELEALDAIDELQAAHIMQPLQGDQFAFDHSLTMQVVLQDMNEARRRYFHRQVAEALESIHEDQLDPVAGLIAHHFAGGNLPARATSYAFRAGRSAANLAAWVEAIAFYEQALALESNEAEHIPIYLAMGNAYFHKGDFALASKVYLTAVNLAQAKRDWPLLEDAHLGLNMSLIPQARYAEAIALAKELRASGPDELALCAEIIWGTALSVESAHPVEAEAHLREAERLLHQQSGYSGRITLTQITYQLAAVIGQQGRSLEAIDLYRMALEMMDRGEGKLDILRNIMLYNNLAYHLNLVGEASAAEYIREGVRLAQEKGSLSHLPYLYSTSGEIALARDDLESAEKYFSDGLSLAEQIPIPERIAGLSANLGLVAQKRGDTTLARELLERALELAEQLGSHYLEVRIRIWLAPLLPSATARACLAVAHSLAEKNGLHSLLEEIAELDQNLRRA